MSIRVNDFQWIPGKNDAEYIKLLKSSRDEWQKIAQKAITKLKTLSRAQEARVMGVDEVRAWSIKQRVDREPILIEMRDGFRAWIVSDEYWDLPIETGLTSDVYGKTWRCRDCENGTPTKNARGEAVIKCNAICWLCRLPRLMEPDWFCADGERREPDA